MRRINPINVVKILETKLRRAEYGNAIGVEDMEFANLLYSIIVHKSNGDDTDIHDVTLHRYTNLKERKTLHLKMVVQAVQDLHLQSNRNRQVKMSTNHLHPKCRDPEY